MAMTPEKVWLALSPEYGLLFREPRAVLEARRPDEVLPVLAEVEQRVEQDKGWAAGFLAYEAAPGLDPALTVRPGCPSPLAWFALYAAPVRTRLPPDPGGPLPFSGWQADTSRETYARQMGVIRSHLRAGDTYQVNYSLRLRAALDPSSNIEDLFTRICRAQRAAYGALITTPDWAVCSASPELFFERRGSRLVTRPMKGTRARGLWSAQDLERRRELLQSEKDRAENLMIVDMARHDCGRIADPGSVSVSSLFRAEAYPTVWQLTSTVRARTAAGLRDTLQALFPAASITGAPKRRTMELIAGLETRPRGIYTGCIGFMAPGRRARFSVAIRTLWIDRRRRRAEYGVGGGIVWDSSAGNEWEECLVKTRVLLRPPPPRFDLLATLRWSPTGGYRQIDRQLARLAASAAYFGFPWNERAIRARLAETAGSLRGPATERKEAWKVRLQVSRSGRPRITSGLLEALPRPYRLRLARHPVEAGDPLLYHKTTHRRIYEEAREEVEDGHDVLLWNRDGEITETLIANVLFRKDRHWITPPLRCGLLPGVEREAWLARGKAREEVVRITDLNPPCTLRLINAVRGAWTAKLLP